MGIKVITRDKREARVKRMSSNAESRFDKIVERWSGKKKVRRERGVKLKYSEVEDRPG
jgi:hypothetical protein